MLRLLLHANAILVLKRWHFQLLQASTRARRCRRNHLARRRRGGDVGKVFARLVDELLVDGIIH